MILDIERFTASLRSGYRDGNSSGSPALLSRASAGFVYCSQSKINSIERVMGPICSALLVQLHILPLHDFRPVTLTVDIQ